MVFNNKHVLSYPKNEEEKLYELMLMRDTLFLTLQCYDKVGYIQILRVVIYYIKMLCKGIDTVLCLPFVY